ncbi:hypothetical protein [Micromonospora sp. NPDC005324]|uniref:hypothetical protein n=1 Tax=Micromonospora sp. NPDC005324 TaxID=3157033 RepID=UPI0033B4801D
MAEPDNQQDHLIRLLAPVHHLPPSAQSPSGSAATLLLKGIMHDFETTTATSAKRAPWLARHRRLAIAVPAVAAAAALAFGISAALPADSGPAGPAPAQAAALQITKDDTYINIKIKDPIADPQRYRKELATYNLNVELTLAPAAPRNVGKIIFSEVGDTAGGVHIEYIEAPGDCTAGGNCTVGIKVPVTFKSYARIVIGRTAMPGEEIEGGSPEDNAQARDLAGKTVADTLKILASRGQTASLRVGWESIETPAEKVPTHWIVYDAAPLPNNVFALQVSADGKPPKNPHPSDGGPTPQPVQPTNTP